MWPQDRPGLRHSSAARVRWPRGTMGTGLRPMHTSTSQQVSLVPNKRFRTSATRWPKGAAAKTLHSSAEYDGAW